MKIWAKLNRKSRDRYLLTFADLGGILSRCLLNFIRKALEYQITLNANLIVQREISSSTPWRKHQIFLRGRANLEHQSRGFAKEQRRQLIFAPLMTLMMYYPSSRLYYFAEMLYWLAIQELQNVAHHLLECPVMFIRIMHANSLRSA